MKLNTRIPDSMVLKWQLEWVTAQTIQICDARTVMETFLLALKLVMVKEPKPRALETNLK
jgi:hypothetical protein